MQKVRGKQMIKRNDRKLIHAATQNYRNVASTKSEKRDRELLQKYRKE